MKKGVAPAAARALLDPLFQRLNDDLAALGRAPAAGAAAGAPAGAPAVLWRYRNCLAGAAIQATEEQADALAAQPYVRAIHLAKPVEALVDLNAWGLCRIGEAIDTYGVHGEGRTIAIIDTGVEYTHPALGGGFGPGFRVVGGWDFANNDADPMDDNGHGTAVAGIAASSDPVVRGVASQCRLLALKALSAQGQGDTAEVVAGLEFALDPDGDPSTADAADVANLSLGTVNGETDDVLDRAVDNAVALGMVVCAAAGNRGALVPAVGSPGHALRAITVGAIDELGRLTGFSSRGPLVNTYEIKPDLCAMGFFVFSLQLHGGMGMVGHGTSYATPFVSGASALLRQLHPEWPPEWIKAALMNAAADFGLPPDLQGAGRLDLLGAAQRRVLAEPSSLSLGIDDLNQDVWTASQALKLHSVTTETLRLRLSVEANLPAGIAASIAPADLSLAPGATGRALFELQVDNRLAPAVWPPPHSYCGDVVIDNGSMRSRVPFSFVDYPEFRVAFSSKSWELALVDSSGVATDVEGGDPVYARLIRPGLYDFAAHALNADGSRSIFARVGLNHSAMTRLEVSTNTCTLNYTVRALDPQGAPFKLGAGVVRFNLGDSIQFDSYSNFTRPIRLSPLPDGARFQWRVDRFLNGQFLQVNGRRDGPMASNQLVFFGPQDYRRLQVDYLTETASGEAYAMGVAMVAEDAESKTFTRLGVQQAWLHHPTPYGFSYYYTPPPTPFDFRYSQFDLHYYSRDDPAFSSALIDLGADPPTRVIPGSGKHILDTLDDRRLTVGEGPFLFSGRFYNRQDATLFRHWAGLDADDILFSGPNGDFWRKPLLVNVYYYLDQSKTILSYPWTNGDSPNGQTIPVAFPIRVDFLDNSGPYDGLQGSVWASADCYMAPQDPNPPYVKRLRILSDGRPSRRLIGTHDNRLRIEVADAESATVETTATLRLGATRVALNLQAVENWRSAEAAGVEETLGAVIPPLPQDGLWTISLVLSDASGNVLRADAPDAFSYRSLNRAKEWAKYE
ncbi:MAG: S8 family serine peptidase [Candidatus Sumerlaeota bacterium]|nr:S8 family serine peptidase [Candidatus Sumerlaeota bacterium]